MKSTICCSNGMHGTKSWHLMMPFCISWVGGLQSRKQRLSWLLPTLRLISFMAASSRYPWKGTMEQLVGM